MATPPKETKELTDSELTQSTPVILPPGFANEAEFRDFARRLYRLYGPVRHGTYITLPYRPIPRTEEQVMGRTSRNGGPASASTLILDECDEILVDVDRECEIFIEEPSANPAAGSASVSETPANPTAAPSASAPSTTPSVAIRNVADEDSDDDIYDSPAPTASASQASASPAPASVALPKPSQFASQLAALQQELSKKLKPGRDYIVTNPSELAARDAETTSTAFSVYDISPAPAFPLLTYLGASATPAAPEAASVTPAAVPASVSPAVESPRSRRMRIMSEVD